MGTAPAKGIESNAVSLIEEERPFQPPLLAHSRHEKTLLSSVWSGMRGQGQNLYVPGVIFGKNLRKVVSDYRRTRPTIEEHKKLKGKKTETYYRANEADFIIYEATLRQLKVLAPGKKLPAISKLNTEIEALISEKNAAYNTYRTAKAEHEQLATAKRNTEQILHGTPSRQKKHEQER